MGGLVWSVLLLLSSRINMAGGWSVLLCVLECRVGILFHMYQELCGWD